LNVTHERRALSLAQIVQLDGMPSQDKARVTAHRRILVDRYP
jgi:hypothetical protein